MVKGFRLNEAQWVISDPFKNNSEAQKVQSSKKRNDSKSMDENNF